MTKNPVARVIALSAGVMGWALFGHAKPNPMLRNARHSVEARAPYDPHAIQKSIAFYAMRAKRDPQSALDYTMLAGAYLQRCRETGDLQDATRAEQAARHSLHIRTRRNAAAYSVLASCLLTQHRFDEALASATTARALQPDNTQAGYLCAEILLERGDYAAAEALERSNGQPEEAVGKALRARFLEINGQPENALTLLRQAQELADRNVDLPRENLAWFHMRVGDELANLGRADAAEQAYREAVEIFPHDYRVLAGLTRLAAGRGDWNATLDWGQKAAAIVPTPEVLALLGDAYTALGRKVEAERQYSLIETIAGLSRAQGSVYDRQRVLFCADHNRHLDEAITLARRELTTRHDIYAYDTLAWICCRTGRLDEAAKAMKQALSRNTQDARLFYHAGVLAYQRGERAQAKTCLTRCLAINPYFQPFAPAEARQLLAQL